MKGSSRIPVTMDERIPEDLSEKLKIVERIHKHSVRTQYYSEST
jgi:hypothetical protein